MGVQRNGDNMKTIKHHQNKSLRTFVAIAESGSFTATAKAMKVTQPAVTFAIIQLEDALDTRLLDRGNKIRTISLTVKGEKIYQLCKQIADLEDKIAEIAGVEADEPTPCADPHALLASRLNAVIGQWVAVQGVQS